MVIFKILIQNENSFIYKIITKLDAIDKFGNIVKKFYFRNHLVIR